MSQHIDNPEYSIRHRKEIISALEHLKKSREAIKLSTSCGEKFITTVLEVNSEKNHVYLDVCPDETMNSRIANDKHLTFTTQTGVLVKWQSTHISKVELPDGTAFSIPVPAVIQRIQRREHFRLTLPQGSRGMICKIPVAEEILEVPVRDMSAGGIGVVLKDPLHPAFSQGTILEGCSIKFPDVGVVSFKLEIRSIRAFQRSTEGGSTYHVGMEFVDLMRGASNVVQRYLIQLEGEKIYSISKEAG